MGRNMSVKCDYLEVTEECLKDVLDCYHSRYRRCTTLDNYVICFEPCLAVGKVLAEVCHDNY